MMALLVTESVPERTPRSVGAKVVLTVQLAPGDNVAGQLLVWAKSSVVWISLMLSVSVPLLVRVTVCGALVVPTTWLANVKLDGASAPADPVPVPAMGSTAGDPEKLPVISKNPENNPPDVGANVTSNVHLAPTAIVPMQWFTTLNGRGHETPLILTGLLVVFVNVTVWIGLVALMTRLPNSRLAGDTNCGRLLPARDTKALPVPLTLRTPDCPVVSGGVKVMLIAQESPGASEAGQLLVCAKGPNAMMMLLMETGSVPVLV